MQHLSSTGITLWVGVTDQHWDRVCPQAVIPEKWTTALSSRFMWTIIRDRLSQLLSLSTTLLIYP